MERLTEKQQELLSQYIDGTLTQVERKSVDTALLNSEAMREHLALLRLIGETLKDRKPEPLAKNFTELVMMNLQQYPVASTTASLKNGIFLLIGVLMAVGVALVLVANGVFDHTMTSLDPSAFEVTKRFVKNPLPTVSLSGKALVNSIIVLNIALAWIVLDRTILKPLFQRRMKVE
jgi:anti-sigma factor RsiW